MRSRSSSFGQRSDDSTRDDNPSPQTPLDAGGNFVHSPPAIMNQPILQQFPLGQNYSLPSEPDCIEHLGTHAHHTPYTNGGVSEQLRRDNELGVGQTSLLSLNGIRSAPLVHRPAHDQPFHGGLNISESSSGSISTSPSSNSSSIAYSPFPLATQYPQDHTSNGLAGAFPTASSVYPTYLPQYNGMSNVRQKISSITDPSIPLLPVARPSLGIQTPLSPQLSSTIRDHYTTSTPGLNRHLISPRSQIDQLTRPSYNPVPETPRSMISATSMSLSPAGGYGTGTTMGYQNSQDPRHVETPPFAQQDDIYEIYCDGNLVKPSIEAKIEKGFFFSNDHCWTCYRRNYFSVQCSYTLSPHCSQRTMYLSRPGGKQEQIQAMAIRLSAAVDGPSGKNIELVQHTPKRDKGPQTAIQITKLAPTPSGGKLPQLHHTEPHSYAHNLPSFGQSNNTATLPPPFLQLQSVPEPSSQQQQQGDQPPTSPTGHQHTFERIQFKSATANNGKRRAQQQYYHLIVELHVDVRSVHDQLPNWVKVAQRVSSQVVVRGRSPSHYANEGPHSTGSRGSGGGTGGSSIGSMGGTLGPFTNGGFGRSLGTGFSYPPLGGNYRNGNQYSLDPSPVGSKSDSASTSLSGGPVEAFPGHGRPNILNEDEDTAGAETTFNGYQYYPGPIWEAGLPSPAKHEGQGFEIGRVKEEGSFHGPGGLFTGGLGRFQGVDSSRGFYTATDAVY